tara:strand:+ start:171 stop:545 length:375 start_codon:yes stop_codon:yes gene_type:complete
MKTKVEKKQTDKSQQRRGIKTKVYHLVKIKNANRQNVTYSKRKRGLIKKTIELSILCGQDIFMVIFDREKQRLVQYSSSSEFDHNIINQLLDEQTRLQFKYDQFTNESYNKFVQKQSDEKGTDL